MNTNKVFYATNPSNNELLEGEFNEATFAEVDEVVTIASQIFNIYSNKDNESIADFLDQIADEILALGDQLIERCHLETGLPHARLIGERGRTMGQLKLFANVVREGSWVDARIDTADPNREPLPKVDIRHMLKPLGPVAVFGASNFPLAFSTAGGDTASALAAGCPVIVKAHEAHPGTSELVAQAIFKAIEKCNMPEGTFSIIYGDKTVGESLVRHSGVKAVGFTGSYRGGKAIFDYANSRPEPIPVFAEMGSTNPVFILPNALEENGEAIASGLVASITMGVGQFCTNPGLSFVQNTKGDTSFFSCIKGEINNAAAGIMLTTGIKNAYDKGIESISSLEHVEDFADGIAGDNPNSGLPRIFKTNIDDFKKNEEALSEENFGPSSVLVESNSKEATLEAARNLKGHLTATVFGTPEDFENYKELFKILETKVGRVVINGYPTGVEVCHAMVHGGPYPSTTAPQSTSVGTNAIKRFVRPVCFQNYPSELLPEALRDENILNIWRLVDGELTKNVIA
ncbi:aldehyde dehydrogenase (NADP(+)) [Seonamhaeicola sp. MEBiC1930]|uniref:aldehyde dehydrogenase (NADP(+)) n=1 Tax=Seonamhaeicola sp. MEBiC01930 TaxID=2976768 RepID=UPI00324B6F70